MKKVSLITLGVGALAVVLVALAGMYKFNYLASQEGYDVDGNKIEMIEEENAVKDFEGEADPNVMKLDMHTWKWIRTSYNNDTELIPNSVGVFILTFDEDGSVSVGTDCNAMSGTYTVDEHKITFGPMMSTLMYCEGSQEQEFVKMLEEVQSYFFTSKGELVFDLKFDSGSSIFR